MRSNSLCGGASGPDTAPAATVEACIAIFKELFYPAPDRKTSCGAAAWNGPSKQCYLKTHKAKPVRAPALILPAEPGFHSRTCLGKRCSCVLQLTTG